MDYPINPKIYESSIELRLKLLKRFYIKNNIINQRIIKILKKRYKQLNKSRMLELIVNQ